jgi:cell division protein FtsB
VVKHLAILILLAAWGLTAPLMGQEEGGSQRQVQPNELEEEVAELHKRVEELEQEAARTDQMASISQAVVSWTGLVFAAFSVVLVFAGVYGLYEFWKIQRVGKEMRDELEDIRKHKSDIIHEMAAATKITLVQDSV